MKSWRLFIHILVFYCRHSVMKSVQCCRMVAKFGFARTRKIATVQDSCRVSSLWWWPWSQLWWQKFGWFKWSFSLYFHDCDSQVSLDYFPNQVNVCIWLANNQQTYQKFVFLFILYSRIPRYVTRQRWIHCLCFRCNRKLKLHMYCTNEPCKPVIHCNLALGPKPRTKEVVEVCVHNATTTHNHARFDFAVLPSTELVSCTRGVPAGDG